MSLFDKYREHHKVSSSNLHDIEGTWPCPECYEIAEAPKYDNDEGVVVNLCDQHPDAKIFIGRGRA